MKNNRILAALMLFFCALGAMAQEYRLWYNTPAEVWTDAMPLGNGRLGAMVFGIPTNERIQLNEETIWAGQPNSNATKGAREWWDKAQQLVFEGKFAEAQQMAEDHIMSRTNHGMPYQTFGDLNISMPSSAAYSNYERWLSLDSAVTVTTYTVGDVTYRREAYTSLSDDVLRVRITASRPGMITFTANLSSPHNDVIIKSHDGKMVSLEGVTPTHERLKGKVKFYGVMQAKAVGGETICRDGVISVSGADEAVIYVNIATNFVNYNDISGDEKSKAVKTLNSAMEHDYLSDQANHVGKFQKYMKRSSLWLGENRFEGVPTDQRVKHFAETDDSHLVATYYAFGRYLLICSSQPGGQPSNLQGIWNDKLFPSWDSKYTCNINLEMNYWPSEITGLTEMNDPLFRLIREVSKTGAATARDMYNAEGWVLHHNTDIWRVTGAIDHATSGLWITGGPWLCHHLWEHFLFTGDKDFLRTYYPIIKGAAKFVDQMLVRDPNTGYQVICPAVSPENQHPGDKGMVNVASGTTMDNQLVAEVFGEVIQASVILGEDEDLAKYYVGRISQLTPGIVGSWGQMQEWTDDWDNPDDTHRHVSHLYGLYPGTSVSAFRTPELFDAMRTSLTHRGDPSTGWSMGWKVCLWARMLDGEHAYRLIKNQLTLTDDKFVPYGKVKKTGGTFGNLFDAHPPFQIDGNFGCTAGIAEMIIQSHDGMVYLLPAIPAKWTEGRITGVHCRGGFIIEEMAWSNGKITKLSIRSTLGGNLRLAVAASDKCLSKLTSDGKKVSSKAAKGLNPNPLCQVPVTMQTLNNSKVKLNAVGLPKLNVIDINTTEGQVIGF